MANDAASVAFADALARCLELRRAPLSARRSPGTAVLAVAPPADPPHRDIELPVVAFPRSATARALVRGRVVTCGVRDERDAPALAIAGALADTLDVPLLAVHVLPEMRAPGYGPAPIAPVPGLAAEDHEWGRTMLERVAWDAGIREPSGWQVRLLHGTAGPTLAAHAARERAALVVVGATTRSRLRRALWPSAAAHLVRHCERPVLVCPPHPAPALRVRAALTEPRLVP